MMPDLITVECQQCRQKFLIPKHEVEQVTHIAERMGIQGEILCDECFNEPELPLELEQ